MSQAKISKGLPHAKVSRKTRHGRHGYRGYGSGFGRGTQDYGGAVHWGRGFAGVDAPGAYGQGTLPHAGFFTAEVWERGPYAGLGPRGYVRSDDRVREDICDELTRRPDLDPTRLTVSVRNGEVTLDGDVESLSARRVVDQIASGCVGVKQVDNRLRVGEADRDARKPARTTSPGRRDRVLSS